MRKITIFITLLVLLFVAGCSSTNTGSENTSKDGTETKEEKVKIKLITPIFEGTTGKEALEGTIIPAFNEEYPNIEVEVEYTTYGQLNEKLTTAMVGNMMPDVVMMGVGWIEGFAKEGQLKSLGDLGVSVDSLSGTFNEKVLAAGIYNNELYAVPIMLDTRLGVYRKDLFEEAGLDPESPPRNWEELREYAIKLTKRDANGNLEVAGLDMLSHDHRQIWLPFLWQNGGELFNADGTEPTFNSTAGVEAVEFWRDLILKDKVIDVGFETGTDATLLGAGMAAMSLTHNDIWIKLSNQNPDLLDKIGFFIVEEKEKAFFHGGTLVSISNNSKHPEEALAFLNHLVDKESALLANEQRGNVPARADLLDSDYAKNNNAIRFAMENLEYAKPEGGIPQWLEVRARFAEELEQVLYERKTPEEALNDLADLARRAIGR